MQNFPNNIVLTLSCVPIENIIAIFIPAVNHAVPIRLLHCA